ncbi:MAG: 4-hydroxyphenylacetate 3-hydroxylase N-terminal domain-containing protein [Elusimicrobiota bacterium]
MTKDLARTNAVWVYLSHTNGRLDAVGLELLGKGRQLAEMADAPLEAVLIGADLKLSGKKALDYGPSTVYCVEHAQLRSYSSVAYARALAELAQRHRPGILLLGADQQNAALAARVAARLETGLSAHCVELKLDGRDLVQTVPGFGGNIMANIVCRERRPQMATVAAGVFTALPGRSPGARVMHVRPTLPKKMHAARLIAVHGPKNAAAGSLAKARTVVAGGFGVGGKENWHLVQRLAKVLGGAVGATRPPVDEGWAQGEQMIGASGKIIKPELYIGLGISGMMHHTVGIHGARVIVAVNSDAAAPIFALADYGIVGSVTEIVPALIRRLETGKGLALKLKPKGHTRTPESYKESLRRMRPNIYKFGKLIEDVVDDPATCRTVEGHAQLFESAHDPRYQDLVTTISSLTGKRISRYLSLIRSPEDMFANSKMKRLAFQLTGTCTGGRCAGWAVLNAMWSATWEIDNARGSDYHQRFKRWLRSSQERDITLSGALTDPKGHRRLPPSKQSDPDMYLRIVKKRKDGIVVRGAKVMICGTAAANEVLVMPGGRLKQSDAEYAVSFAIPRDAKGLTVVEARRASDDRDLQSGFDNPVTRGGITQAYLFFEDVFVPKERVFMCGEHGFAGDAVFRFTLPYRSAIGGCVAGQGDVMMGASALIARANGLNEKVFRDKLIRMIVNNETTFGLGIAAAVLGTQHPSGTWLPDPVMANVNKVHVATLPYETKRLTQEIAGGIGETGCMPSHKDFMDSRYGHLIQKYMKAHSPAETRARIARLIEWLTLGGGVPGCMHGGGSPDGARMIAYSEAKLDEMIEMAKRIGGISDVSLRGE